MILACRQQPGVAPLRSVRLLELFYETMPAATSPASTTQRNVADVRRRAHDGRVDHLTTAIDRK